jgi:2-oxo-3-hexenedioate decarboxylase
MKDRLEGPGVTREHASAAVGEVRGGAEVIDSRYRDFKFSVGDVIADNASSGAYLLGDVAAGADELDLAAEAVEVVVDGEVVHRATGADVLGHPAEALALAVNDLATRGLAIEAGWIVLTGGMSDAVYATPGSTVICRFAHLGDVALESGRPH